MSIQSRLIEYGGGKNTFEGMLVWDDAVTEPRPGVLVAHTIRGRTGFEEGKARDLAELGYVGFALDVYGQSEIGSDDANTRANMDALKSDRSDLQERLNLALHGWDDPLATPDKVVALGEELSELGADWQIHGYGKTMHAFTNPSANDMERGTVYDAAADRRSWIAMKNFLAEQFK